MSRGREGALGSRRILASYLTSGALVLCVAVALLSDHDQVLTPLTLVVAAAAIFASATAVEMDAPLLVDAAFVPLMLAVAFLGPAAAFAVCVVAELGSWPFDRRRPITVPINLVGIGTPTLLAAIAIERLEPASGIPFYLMLAGVALAALLLNLALVTTLTSWVDGESPTGRMRRHRALLPALSINVILALAAAAIYEGAGLGVLAFLLLMIIVFNYLLHQVRTARNQTDRAAKLAQSQSDLVAQAVNTEERERRALAETLHDGALQSLLAVRQDLREASQGNPSAISRADDALDETVKHLRGTVSSLYPSVLDYSGLAQALTSLATQLARRSSWTIDVSVADDAVGSSDRLIYSLTRELMLNVVKHAAARHVRIAVTRYDGGVELEVEDDGTGFRSYERTAAVRNGHVGLASCAERVESVGGSFEIYSEKGTGTLARVRLAGDGVDPTGPPPLGPTLLTSISKDKKRRRRRTARPDTGPVPHSKGVGRTNHDAF